MKQLNNYILEKLVITKDTKEKSSLDTSTATTSSTQAGRTTQAQPPSCA